VLRGACQSCLITTELFPTSFTWDRVPEGKGVLVLCSPCLVALQAAADHRDSPYHRVDLLDTPRPVLLVRADSSIVFENQVAGDARRPEWIEGFAVPLPELTERVFDPAWWRRRHPSTLSRHAWGAICDEIEHAVWSRRPGHLHDFHVDRRSGDQAWAHVKLLYDHSRDPRAPVWVAVEGVLTWANAGQGTPGPHSER
jgi:hypothetical protein